MPTTFMRFSFKSNMLHSAKSQLTRFYSMKQGPRMKNHYDTLNITPHATQNEVKSAYYKLTLQFHPDKNKTEYAKQRFQDISDAYEVLSNHEQRRIYDRSILVRRQPMSSTTVEEPMSNYRDKVYSGSSKIYNFDAWTQAHYGQQMHATRMRRQAYEYQKKTEEMRGGSKDNPRFMEIAVFFLTLIMITYILRENPDVPRRKRERESKDT
ncbi:dnaJ homolog subfamily C member 30, mitochondrial [Monomorium pharaonis]|uniref:dnaJ homolog subfamily C member 30, mitochondrial n=1 Tax=Monomorium pharaonis TaxID=307658 RepID=UPI00063F1863|nr:dnaJ homolog subfamily C member 30, mitochondrial [Monomorium pharaonis]